MTKLPQAESPSRTDAEHRTKRMTLYHLTGAEAIEVNLL
jgi:hypothetical protein